jgi:PIN domain nuclease of toxin-antitoxin system
MSYLLDTHTLIWFINGDEKLPLNVRNLIQQESQGMIFVSAASFWEMAIKVSLGKLELTLPFSQTLTKVKENGFVVLDIYFKHTLHLSQLPFHHRDPFDRTLIAQALSENLTIITKEKLFEEYGIKRLWQ